MQSILKFHARTNTTTESHAGINKIYINYIFNCIKQRMFSIKLLLNDINTFKIVIIMV